MADREVSAVSGVQSIERHEILTLRAQLEKAKIQRDLLLWSLAVALVALAGCVMGLVNG